MNALYVNNIPRGTTIKVTSVFLLVIALLIQTFIHFDSLQMSEVDSSIVPLFPVLRTQTAVCHTCLQYVPAFIWRY